MESKRRRHWDVQGTWAQSHSGSAVERGGLAKCHTRAQAAPALHVLMADARLAEETGDAG